MSQSMNVQLHLPYLKKNVTAPKISRFKLQDEFACRGWNTCSSPFKIKSGESECDIISSPTKYPSSKELSANENHSKKKPMLVEISNIESIFLQNKQKSARLNDDRKLSEAFHDFMPKLTKQEKLNVTCQRKRAQNLLESSQNKKHCNEFSKNQKASNFFISSSIFIKENSNEKAETFNEVNTHKKLCDSFIHIESDDASTDKKTTKGKFIKLDTSLKVPNISSVPVKSSQNKILKTEHKTNGRSQNSESCSKSHHLFFHSKDTHYKSLKSHIVTDLIPDCGSVEKVNCSKKVNLSSSKSVPNAFINDSVKAISATVITDSPILIQDDSPESLVSSTVPYSPVLFQPCDVNKSENFTNEHRKNHLYPESLKLQDLQESFHINVHEESPTSSDSPMNLISDCSPIKENNYKQDVPLSITNKFKILSEAFASTSADVKVANEKYSSDELIQNQCSPVYMKAEKALSTCKTFPSFKNEIDNSVKEHEASEVKSSAVSNKTFMKAIQSSFLEKSSLGDKGSSWVQTLNWDQFSQSKGTESELDEHIGKKSLKNIIHGGFAEQMLKLQRRECSDRVIWNHKMNELKRKAAVNVITFTLSSILHVGQVIMTKSTTTDISNENLRDFLCNKNIKDSHSNMDAIAHGEISYDTSLPKSQPFIVLFRRGIFAKMHLKVGDDFSLYPPWQFLSVPSLPFPVILCTYFVEPIIKNKESVLKEPSEIQSFPVLYKSLQIKACECNEPVLSNEYLLNSSDLYGKSVCVSTRVQRIWKNEVAIADNRLQDILKIYDHSFSLLLQTQDGIFLELKVNSNQLTEAYLEFLSGAEGKCFRFCDVVISHRYNLIKYHQWKTFIKYIQNNSDNALSMQQMFCYQLRPTSFNKIPCDILGENFPFYCDYNVKPLSFLQKNNQGDMRFSCIGKIVFQNKGDFYITDESLLCSKVKKYHLLKFENSTEVLKESLVGVTILIKEAVNDENYLFVDKFSSYATLSSSNKLMLAYESRIKKIGLISYEHVLSPLSLSSKIKQLVLIKGIISEVDESTAVSWLECSFCFGENLLEDSNSVIYCEDCACSIPKPVLKVKMEVIVQDTCLSPAKVKIQLLSSTVKKILKISEDNHQPECNISDVLKKSTGVLCCCIKNIEMTDKQKVFHLTEICSC